jgi:DNA-binding MarR family transcriptional regulator
MSGHSPETRRTADAIRRATTRLARQLRRLRAGHGISAAKLAILGQLHRAGHTLTAVDLARGENLQPQSVTRLIAELEELGLISRAPGQTDRRQIMIGITPAGRDLLVQDALQQNAWLAQAIDTNLTGTEQALLHLAASLLDRLGDSTQNGAPPPLVIGSVDQTA